MKSRTPNRITKPNHAYTTSPASSVTLSPTVTPKEPNPAYTPPPAKPNGVDPSSSDFGALCTCAIRYSIGRRTYMPSLIIGYLTPFISKLETRTLVVIATDIKGATNLGDDCDAADWNRFLSAVDTEIAKRRESS